MNESNHTDSRVDRCIALLHSVNVIYREMEAAYAVLQGELPAISAESLLEKTRVLDRLRGQAQAVDGQLAEELRRSEDLDDSLHPLLATRADTLERLSRMNRDLLGHAENSRALLRHELTTMRTNRSALQGYRPPGGPAPGLIRTSF